MKKLIVILFALTLSGCATQGQKSFRNGFFTALGAAATNNYLNKRRTCWASVTYAGKTTTVKGKGRVCN